MQDPATLPAMLCAFARFSGHCMLKSRSFSICSETHVITASSGLISHWVCLTLSDTRTRVWANCSNHKNPARRAGNTHTHLHAQTEGPFLYIVGRVQWRCDQNTHTETLTHTHMLGESEEEYGKQGLRETGTESEEMSRSLAEETRRQMPRQKGQRIEHLSG